MIALQIEDIPAFTRKLFLGETFDSFLVREAEFSTFCTFSISGKVNQNYYNEEELEQERIEEYASWKKLRPLCFSLIKGKKLPEGFSIVLKMPPEAAERFIRSRMPEAPKDFAEGLYLHLRYANPKLSAVTGISLARFTLDKTLEREWDDSVKKFLTKNEIPFVEM